METLRCMRCMRPYPEGERKCACGHVHGQEQQPDFALPCGSILKGKYLVGSVIGQGGFGITYVGFDLSLKRKIAVKEYFPMGLGVVSRTATVSATVTWNEQSQTGITKDKGYRMFHKEARKMAKLNDIPGIVGVKDIFTENDTAYIVMDFIEGRTLKQVLKTDGPMPYDKIVSLLTPVIQELSKAHAQGIIHRDISPDNLMLTPEGQIWLLDLGAAKELDLRREDNRDMKSSQLVIKEGYSPIEQYTAAGAIGPWTDVYAMAATIYHMVTGKIPDNAADRAAEDTLACRKPLTEPQFAALKKGLAVMRQDRLQTMDELLEALTQAEPVKQNTKFLKWLLPAAGVVAAGILAAVLFIRPTPAPPVKLEPTETTLETRMETEPTVPTTIPETQPPEDTRPIFTMAAIDESAKYYSTMDNNVFWGQEQYRMHDVKGVVFQDSMEGAPDTAWDMSETQDGTILAWMEENGELHVAANGRIAPNPIADYLFLGFVNAAYIDFGGCFYTSNVTSMKHMFNSCTSLAELDLSCMDTANAEDMECMFTVCWELKKLDLSGFIGPKTSNLLGFCADCKNLEEVDLSGCDTSGAENMIAMFADCRNLKELDLSSFRTERVSDFRRMFSNCTNLSYLDISGFSAESTPYLNTVGMFEKCDSLFTVSCKDSLILNAYQRDINPLGGIRTDD